MSPNPRRLLPRQHQRSFCVTRALHSITAGVRTSLLHPHLQHQHPTAPAAAPGTPKATLVCSRPASCGPSPEAPVGGRRCNTPRASCLVSPVHSAEAARAQVHSDEECKETHHKEVGVRRSIVWCEYQHQHQQQHQHQHRHQRQHQRQQQYQHQYQYQFHHQHYLSATPLGNQSVEAKCRSALLMSSLLRSSSIVFTEPWRSEAREQAEVSVSAWRPRGQADSGLMLGAGSKRPPLLIGSSSPSLRPRAHFLASPASWHPSQSMQGVSSRTLVSCAETPATTSLFACSSTSAPLLPPAVLGSLLSRGRLRDDGSGWRSGALVESLGVLFGRHGLKAVAQVSFLHGTLRGTVSSSVGPTSRGLASLRPGTSSQGRWQASLELPAVALCVASEAEACAADDTSSESASSAGDKAAPASSLRLRLVSGASMLPHPEKAERGGEDAYFISSTCDAVGVADGVGGWADLGIDAGAYARELMAEAMKAVEGGEAVVGEGEGEKGADPAQVLQVAHARTSSQGSSTACLVFLCDQKKKVTAANVGDSGFMIIRSGRTIFKSPPQQHDFNFPFQLGSAGGDPPSSAQVFCLPVAPGDVIVLGTDGLFDNVFDAELASMVAQSLLAGRTPQSTAEHITALARIRAADRIRFSPFARAAMEAGYRYYGGKMDDITVVVCYVAWGGDAAPSSKPGA